MELHRYNTETIKYHKMRWKFIVFLDMKHHDFILALQPLVCIDVIVKLHEPDLFTMSLMCTFKHLQKIQHLIKY